MDKSWITKERWSRDYVEGVKMFLEFASRSVNLTNQILCPCKVCVNRYYFTLIVVKGHLMTNGFFPGYRVWNRHGEEHMSSTSQTQNSVSNIAVTEEISTADTNMIEQLLRDTFEIRNENTIPTFENTEPTPNIEENDDQFTKLLGDAATELFPGCKNFSKLSFILQLYRLKCLNSWTERSFDMLLELLIRALPDGSLMPKNTYEVKKILKAFDVGYQRIDACPNNCMLFWGDEAEKEECKNCGASRWDVNHKRSTSAGKKQYKKAAKIMRYFPLIPRLQRLYKNKKTAEDMLWHQNGRTKDGLIRHPADGEAWKSFDIQFPEFASDPRNIRLGLSSDGFNPYKLMSTTYSIWPVILVPYNMAPWIGMKQESFILSTLIPGNKSPGNDIDVYLQPLIKELQDLWHGVKTYDAATGEYFIMRAALFWTINDFPAYAMLAGWSTKGRYACPCCAEGTDSLWLYKSKKFSYMGHRQWLRANHPFRSQKDEFNNVEDFRCAPSRSSGSQILQKLQNHEFTYGIDTRPKAEKKKKRRLCAETSTSSATSDHILWKKKSIFFQLSYWEFNKLPHNLDVMHIEKNVSENLLDTLLYLEKSKDNIKGRQDLVDIGMRHHLHPQLLDSGAYLLPPTKFTMSKQQIQMFCQVLKNMKLPKNYASNISRCVHVAEGKLTGLKSHDHHVLIEDILPVALASCAPSVEVMAIIVDLSRFLKSLCATVINPAELDEMQETISLTLCQMEKYFLPSFFKVMVHLLVHLVEEVRLGGPVQYRWMYPFERCFSVLKNYVGNKARPEGSIAEGYMAEEGIIFCSKYVKVGDNSGFDEAIVDYKFDTKGSTMGKITYVHLDEKSMIQIHRYVLRHCDIVEPLRRKFIIAEKRKRRDKRPTLNEADIEKLINENFHEYFKIQVLNDVVHSQNEELKALACGPSRRAKIFKKYCTNGYNYHTKDIDENRKTQNHGVVNKTEAEEFTYIGRIVEMIDVSYSELFHVVLFKCEWANTTSTGMKTDQFGNKIVNFTRLIHTGDKVEHDPYVFSSQVDPIYFIDDPKNISWKYVVKGKARDVFNL